MWDGELIEYAVYIPLDPGDDADAVVRAAASLIPPEFDFSIRTNGDSSESVDVELYFRIRGVEHPDEALAKALRIYRLSRQQAGLRPADHIQVSLEPASKGDG